MTPTRIVSALVVAAALVPAAAHAASGEILYRTASGSVTPGAIANLSASTFTAFGTDSGWFLYRDGTTTQLAEGFLDSDRVWVTVEGRGVWHDATGVLWQDDGTGAQRLLGPGDPCPDGAGGTVQYLGANVSKGYGPYALVDCFGRPQIHGFGADGSTIPLAVEGTNLPGFDGAAGAATLGLVFDNVAWTVGPGDVVFSAQVSSCSPDPTCPGDVGTGTFRLGDSDEAVYVAGGDAPGLPPEYRGSVLGHVRTNAAGDVGFVHESFGPPVPAIFVRNAEGLWREVAIVGQAAPGTGTTYAGIGLVDQASRVKFFELDTEGHAAFTARTATDGADTLWEETGAGVRRLIWPGMELPGAPGTSVVEIEQVVASPSGRLAAVVENGSGTVPSQVVLAQDADGEMVVVWHRDLPINDEMFEGQVSLATDEWGSHWRAPGITDEGRLTMAINGGPEAIAVVINVDADERPDETDIGLDFVLYADAPIYWGQHLDFDAVISNFDASEITHWDLTIELPEGVTDPVVDCDTFDYDAATRTLTPRCDEADEPLSLPNGRDIGFSLQTPMRDADAPLVLDGTVSTTHANGQQGMATVQWTFPLLKTPDLPDLEATVDDTVAATSFAVRNVGLVPATSVIARATLDAGAGHFTVPDDPRCERSGDDLVLTCNVGDLAPGDGMPFDFPELSDGTGTLVVESATADENPANDSVRFTLRIDVDPVQSDACDGCTSGDSPTHGWWMVGLFALAWRRRPRTRGV